MRHPRAERGNENEQRISHILPLRGVLFGVLKIATRLFNTFQKKSSWFHDSGRHISFLQRVGNCVRARHGEIFVSPRSRNLQLASASISLLFGSTFLLAQDATTPASALPDSSVHVITATSATSNDAPGLRQRTVFGHDIEIYNWQTQFEYQKDLGRGWQLDVYENFNSVLQQQARGEAWKDDHSGGLTLSRQMTRAWRMEALAHSKIFFDEFTGSVRNTASEFSNNDFSLNRFNLRGTLELAQRLRLSSGIGYRWEDILERKDYGPHFEINVALAPTHWANYEHQFDLTAQLDDLPLRRNDDLNITYGIARQFERNASDSLFVRFTHARRENYFTASFIDELNRNRRGLENRLNYRVGETWQFQLVSELSEASVEVGRRLYGVQETNKLLSRFRHEDLEAQQRAQLLWRHQSVTSDLNFIYRSRKRNYEIPDSLRVSPLIRRYAGEGYDSDDWDLALSHRLQWRIGRRDSLRWFGRVTRYAHDTANLDNPNDYDRLQMQANVLYEHRFHAHLRLRWEARTYLEHQVYLKSNLSGDNRWTRIWQLLPQVLLGDPAGLALKQSFGVRATFIDYDFPQAISNRTSIVLRDFFIADSLTAPLSTRATLEVQYKLALEERGLLNWEEWLQSPQADIRRHLLVLQVRQRLARHWDFTPGLSYYHEKHWSYKTRPLQQALRVFSHEQFILSPKFDLSYFRPPHTLVYLTARRQMSFRTLAGNTRLRDRNIDTFSLTLQWAW